MKKRTILVVVLAAASSFLCAPAMARSSVHFGFNFGVPLGPWYYPPYYYAPYYYPPPAYYPPVIQAPAPSTYIERPGAPADDAQSWWYYCAESKTYYPYAKTCPGGWERVSPRPPG